MFSFRQRACICLLENREDTLFAVSVFRLGNKAGEHSIIWHNKSMLFRASFPGSGRRGIGRMKLFNGKGKFLAIAAITSLGLQAACPGFAFGQTAPPAPAAAPAADAQGALYGKVIDVTTGKPVPDATVALQDKKGKVIAWTKTDAQGQYAIPADCLKTLELRPSRRRGLLSSLARGIGKVVTVPVKAAVDGATTVIKQVNPAATVKATAISAATGNPLPAVSQITSTTVASLKETTEKKARENAARTVMGERLSQPAAKKEEIVPGEVYLAVSAPNFKALKGKAGAYWLEPIKTASEKKDEKPGTRAWLETVKLAPAAGDKKSEVEKMAVLLGEPRIDPVLAPAGATLTISTKLMTPAGQPLVARVFAREDKKKKVVELTPQAGNVFSGQLVLDPETPTGETTVTVVALRAEPIEVDLKESKDDPLLHFAEQLDELDADKAYDFDPRIMASENRLDLKVTILDPKQGNPVTPAAAPTAPTAPATPAAAPPAAPPTTPPTTPATPPAK